MLFYLFSEQLIISSWFQVKKELIINMKWIMVRRAGWLGQYIPAIPLACEADENNLIIFVCFRRVQSRFHTIHIFPLSVSSIPVST